VIGVTRRNNFLREQTRLMIQKEKAFAADIKPILKRQWQEVADHIRQGTIQNLQWEINKYMNEMIKAFEKNYMKIGAMNFTRLQNFIEGEKPKGFSRYDKKDFESVFWTNFKRWVKNEAAKKVTKIDLNTFKIMNKIVSSKIKEGNTYYEIARAIEMMEAITTIQRAKTIARTETHTAFNNSTHESMLASDIAEEKEWMSALDERTRDLHITADGERVGIKDYFTRTGESLMFPGDPSGSAENIINCRCVALYS